MNTGTHACLHTYMYAKILVYNYEHTNTFKRLYMNTIIHT